MDGAAEALRLLILLGERRPQQNAGLLFDRAAVRRRLDAQAGFQRLLEITNGKIRHGAAPSSLIALQALLSYLAGPSSCVATTLTAPVETSKTASSPIF